MAESGRFSPKAGPPDGASCPAVGFAHPCANPCYARAIPAFGCDARRRLRVLNTYGNINTFHVARMERSGIRGSGLMRRNSLALIAPYAG